MPTNILMIAFFNYYYTFLQLDPDDVSEQLKRQGASIPLVRPGKSTAIFIKTVTLCCGTKFVFSLYWFTEKFLDIYICFVADDAQISEQEL